jgi:AcrR family transcriptional regulator
MNSEAPNPPDDATQSADQREPARDPRRANILGLAQQLFAQKGYEATTMAEIAQAANLAVGTLYKIFKDKRDLYQTLVADTVQDFERQLTTVLEETPGDELARIHKYIDVGAQLFVEHLPFIRVYFSETGAAFLFTTAGLEDDAFQSYWRIVAALRETFRRGIETGLFVDVDPAVLALALEGVHNSFLGALVRDPDSFTPEQIAEYTKRLFFDSVLRR